MPGKVKATFFLGLRYIQEANAGTDTDELISEARSLAEQWIDKRWKGEGLADPTHRPVPNKSLAGNLKEFWNIIILAAKRSAGDEQLKIIDLIREKMHNTGMLKRVISTEGKVVHGPPTDEDRVETAETPDGRVWSDLPYLRHEFFEAILRPPFITPADQWTNLNEFGARLTASGVRELSFYAIWAMFDALEVRQNLRRRTGDGTPRELSIVDWLPAALVWLDHCGLQMLKACQAGVVPPDQTHDDYDCKWYGDGPEYVGNLAREAGIDRAGFSMER